MRFKKNKYNNKKVIYKGIKFDSIKEKNRFIELKLMEKAGEIKNLTLQPEFPLTETIKNNGKTFRKSKYIADFEYIDKSGERVVEDVKGFKTDLYNFKVKVFLNKYGHELKFKEI